MKEFCVFKPEIKGKPSILYNGLLDFTANDRKLTNFLYAVSSLEKIKNLFNKSEFNSLGEINTLSFINKFNLKTLINAKAKIKNAKRDLKAINMLGNTIYYDDIEDIIDKVINFNDSNTELKASIKYDNKLFFIDVDTINSENYNNAYTLKYKKALYLAVLDYLKSKGINTKLSPLTKKFFNPLNIYYSALGLKTLANGLKILSKNDALLLLDLISDSNFRTRIITYAGGVEEAADLIAKSSYISNLEEHVLNLIHGFLSDALKKLSALNSVELSNILNDTRASINNDSSYFGIDAITIRNILEELNEEFHINKEAIAELSLDISKVSELALEFLRLKAHDINRAKLKGINTKKLKKLLENLAKLIKYGRYIESIAMNFKAILSDITKGNEVLENNYKALKEANFILSPNKIQNLSKALNALLFNISTYKKIITLLSNIDLLEDDDIIVDEELKLAISNEATTLLSNINKMSISLRKLQFDIVYAFLKLYWGEDKIVDGLLITLEDILRLARTDINILDRLIYSMSSCNDEALGLLSQAVTEAHRLRDKRLIKIKKDIDSITKELFKSTNNTNFMYLRDSNNTPTGLIISKYDYIKYNLERKAYIDTLKSLKLSNYDFNYRLQKWEKEHNLYVTFSEIVPKQYWPEDKNIIKQLTNTKIKVPKYTDSSVLALLTPNLKTYYYKMLVTKLLLSIEVGYNAPHLFSAVLISNDLVNAFAETGGNPKKIWLMAKNKVVDIFKQREDETEYGGISSNSQFIKANIDVNGEEIMLLPLFFTHEIKDKTRLSTDFSRSILAYAAASINYSEMNKIIDPLLLTKDFLLHRTVPVTKGNRVLMGVLPIGENYINSPELILASLSLEKGLIEDYFERVVFNRLKKQEFIGDVRVDKIGDALIGYSSITGLSVNFMGAVANVVVGKLLILIESGCGEFFGWKDLAASEKDYWKLLIPLLGEINAPRKNSKLGLLYERFNALDDFYTSLKETGFYKNPISKVIGNTSLLFMYGLGEHYLHGLGMLAVLHHVLVKNAAGEKSNLLDILEVKDGDLVIKPGYRIVSKKQEKNEIPFSDLEEANDAYLDKMLKRIAYVNRSMHGAFNEEDKGMIHKYAFGRLVMNFRLWMPAHYSRRFRGRHYESDLGEYREGYYRTMFKFIRDVIKDFRHLRFSILTNYKELSEADLYNLKRAIAEIAILAMLDVIIRMFGDETDKEGRWARMCIYELKRAQLEVGASTPSILFVENIITMINSPIAAVKDIEVISDLINVTDAFEVIEKGEFASENKWVHNFKKNMPFIRSIRKQLSIGEDNSMFTIFKD